MVGDSVISQNMAQPPESLNNVGLVQNIAALQSPWTPIDLGGRRRPSRRIIGRAPGTAWLRNTGSPPTFSVELVEPLRILPQPIGRAPSTCPLRAEEAHSNHGAESFFSVGREP